ncbi:MAG: hypothetical protein IPG69_19355 [Flavobacteriales bacterium]|nr:hypothetical protein [Flavobacteriales bacterium]
MKNTCNRDDTPVLPALSLRFDDPGDHCANLHSMTVPGFWVPIPERFGELPHHR